MKNGKDDSRSIEAVVGVFDDPVAANQAAHRLSNPDVEVRRVSIKDPSAEKEMPEIFYDNVDEVSENDVSQAVLKGGAIGAGSGLLFIGVPGLNVVAPIVGALTGAWIGGIAGIDEALRGMKLPKPIDYRKLLAEGKSFVVIAAEESARIRYEAELEELGAIAVHQHPPVREAAFHEPETDSDSPE